MSRAVDILKTYFGHRKSQKITGRMSVDGKTDDGLQRPMEKCDEEAGNSRRERRNVFTKIEAFKGRSLSRTMRSHLPSIVAPNCPAEAPLC
jgi:hypothetical protein